ncbi:Baculoviral IAP repeat-containing protein 2 [Branchiostoma belcheri]|nr:Baculoviral IAP repeat-containing protein 2 [Branchiostoma belcheri]
MAPATAVEAMHCEMCDEPAYEWCGCCKAAFCHICDALVHKHSKRRSHVRVPISRENQLDKKENEEHHSTSLSTEAGLVSRPPDTAAQRQGVTDILDLPLAARRQVDLTSLSQQGEVERKRQEDMRTEGLQMIKWFREAENAGFLPEEVQAALFHCGNGDPVQWLKENWHELVYSVAAQATEEGKKLKTNIVRVITTQEAAEALRKQQGDIAKSIKECIDCRRKKKHEMADEQARIESFLPWPLHAPVNPESLAQAGFYHTDFDDPWVEHARWYPGCELLGQLEGGAVVRAEQASRSSPDYTQSQQHAQYVLESALDSRWYLFRSALGQLQLYDSHLRISLPLSSGKHRHRFQVLLQVNGQAMVVDVASVQFLKNPPSTETARQVSLLLEDETAVMEKLQEVLFTNSSGFPDMPCGFRPGQIYLHRLDRKKKVVVSSAAHANSQRGMVLVAPINELGTADINQITSANKADLLSTSDDQYYDIARLLDDLDKRFFTALGPDPRQICTDMANMSLSNPTWTGSRKLPLEQPFQREVSSEVISAQAHLEYGPGHIPKSTTFLHTVDQRGLRQESRRLQTFVDWPQSTPVKPEHLAAAGFFYTGRGDNVQCCTCGNVLNHWREGDDPELEHFYRFPDCEFAIGYDVGNVPISSSLEPRQETVSLERELDRLREERMCKICMEEDAVIVFLPCGHFAVCQTCSATLCDCPICRKQIDGTVRVFMT